MSINYPLLTITKGGRLAFLFSRQALLHREHQVMGKWKREGITFEEYQRLSPVVRQSWPYFEGCLTLGGWRLYEDERFDPCHQEVNKAFGVYRVLCFQATSDDVNGIDNHIIQDVS